MEGWISLYRKIQEHWLWTQKRKFSQFEAWISLLLKANFKDTKVNIDGKITEIKKGSFITSEIKLSKEWNWSRATVRKFLKILENEKMIRKNSTTKYTSVTIENWELYQNQQQQNIQQSIQQSIQVVDNTLDTDNKDNNINNNLFNFNINNKSDFVPFKEGDEVSQFLKEKGINSVEEYKELDVSKQDELIEEWFLNTR